MCLCRQAYPKGREHLLRDQRIQPLEIHIYEKRAQDKHGVRNVILALSPQTEGLLNKLLTNPQAFSPSVPLGALEVALRKELTKYWWGLVKIHWYSNIDLSKVSSQEVYMKSVDDESIETLRQADVVLV